MIAVALACAIVGWVFAFFIVIQTSREKAEQRSAYESLLAAEHRRVESLITQMQANAQGFQHYPQLGPFPAEPERKFLTDDTGLIVYEETDDDRDFAEAANV